jgi:DnaJ-class molecular chaperone
MRTSDGDEWTDVVPTCAQCDGAGTVLQTQMIGPGMLQQSTAPCSRCSGSGTLFPETCLTVTEVHEVDITLPTGGVAAQTTPIVLAGKGGTAYIAGERPQARALHVHIERVADDPHADWTLRGHALVWRPKRNAMEGCFMDELFCQHPNGNVYQLRMTDQRADTMVVPQLGLGEGPLLIQVQWQWNRTPWRSQRWFQALSSKLRSQYVHLQHSCTASFNCTTPDAYDAASSARGHASQEDGGETTTPQCRQS